MSSDSDDENVIRYGTPLEPYEEDEVPSKRKCQPPDQYAVDAHGRRRFHGAFTGGFSAGFGNTVGTPEGWTPATFKSSKSEKAQVSNKRPEDFMDEEDRSEFGIAPRTVVTQSEFSGQKRPRQRQYFDGTIPGEPVLNQLIRAVHETAAVRILRGMGWRDGRGTGERVTKEQRRAAKERHKVYGCYIPPELRQNTEQQSDEDSTDSEFDFETLFAPDDYEPYVLSRKSDRFGLGYSGLSRHSVLGSMSGEYGGEGSRSSHLQMRDKGKKVSIRGQAFGVGAFETEDDDIYATEDMSHYDTVLGGPSKQQAPKKINKDIGHVLEGFVPASKPLPPVPSYPPPALPRGYTPAPAGQKRSRFEHTHAPQRDQGLGRHELSAEARGALLGEKPLPKVPETSIQSTSVESLSIQTESIEPPIQNKEDPIAKLLGRNVSFVSRNEIAESEKKEGAEDFISIKDSGQELTNTFKPFAGNPAKQKRYEKYLQDKEGYMAEQEGKMDKVREWEKERELIEFEQAAKLYKPLTGIMGDRFTHASEPDEALNPLCAVAKSSVNYGLATPDQIEAAKRGMYGILTRIETPWRPESLVCKRFNVPEPGVTRDLPKKDEKSKISYSVFSYLESSVHNKDSFTKEQSKFSGSKSLASDVISRNKQNKGESSKNTVSEGANKKDNIGGAIVESSSNKINTNKNPESTETNTGFTKRLTVAELFMKESEKNKEEGKDLTETINDFDKMDLYKSIFLSDSEDEEPKQQETKQISFEEFLDGPKNVERNTSPPKGIFANVNFDEINSWRRNADDKISKSTDNKEPNLKEKIDANKTPSTSDKDTKSSPNKIEKDNKIENANEEITEADMYGPKIPENLKKRLEQSTDKLENFRPIFRSKTDKDKNTFSSKTKQDNIIHEIDSSSSDSWVDVNEIKSKKEKKRKNKKHKSKHKKSKHKKKDR